MNRVHSIDYLRGLMALAVMAYHYQAWAFTTPDSSTILGKLGIYAVAIFYIVSGISLQIVYRDMQFSVHSVVSFFVKRIFRLAPVLWMVTLLTVALYAYKNPAYVYDFKKLFLNLTFAFGFVAPSQYIAGGAWSIGNEAFFYSFFPLLILFSRNRYTHLLFVGVLLFFYLRYAFFTLSPDKTIGAQWPLYVSPMNQAFLFGLGTLIPAISDWLKMQASGKNTALMLVAMAAFALYPSTGNQVTITTEWGRLIFTAMIFLVCLFCYNAKFTLGKIGDSVLSFFGEKSYSIYLFHILIAMTCFKFVLPLIPNKTPLTKLWLLSLVAVPATILVAAISHKYIEIPFIKLAKRLTKRRNPAIAALA